MNVQTLDWTKLGFDGWLPVIFMVVMGLAMLAYVILDGYDLGVGILMHYAQPAEKDQMVASIGPFWDANETWLVLGVGILLTCFPLAHGVILGALYLPVALMLVGLILRGVAFDFRVKARVQAKPWWDSAFFVGSLLATLSQGWMLGSYILGFLAGWQAMLFAALIAVCLAAGYSLLGAAWLIMKTEGALQMKAVVWAKKSWVLTVVGVLAVSIATPLLSNQIFNKWFTLPYVVLLAPIPLATALLFFMAYRSLDRLPKRLADNNNYGEWIPFACTAGIFGLSFYGLAYSLFPYIVMEKLTIWEAASAPEALKIILAGASVVLPVIIIYTVFAYRIFRGKARELSYTQ